MKKFYGLVTMAALLVSPLFSYAAVWTDKDDYSPGETVTISGDGYFADETIAIDVAAPYGSEYGETTADENGAFVWQFTLPSDESAVGDYSYTVTGLESGVVQSGVFTDAPTGSITITDVSQSEGNSGTTTFTFNVTLTRSANGTISTNYSTSGVSASGGASCTGSTDYVSTSGLLSWNGSTSGIQTINVTICGDTTPESDETFNVNLTANQGNITFTKSVGLGTIQNDDGSTPTTATLTLQKTVEKDNGGNETDTDWTLSASGPTPISGVEGAASVTDAVVSPGSYDLSESGPAGYSASDWVCTGTGTQDDADTMTLAAGQSAVCTITNDDIAPTITLIKNVVTDHGGTAGPDDFGLTIGGTSVNSGQALVVDANTPYVLNEAGLPGYQFISITGAGCPANLGDSVTLNEGENLTCTIENDDIPGEIRGFKFFDINGNGVWDFLLGEPGIENWIINLSGPVNDSTATAGDGSYAFVGLAIGDYNVTEDLPSGWTQTTGPTNPISVSLGQVVENVNFGNACFVSTGGKSKGFWTNKNGEAVMKDGGTFAPELALLAGYHLRNENGSDFNPATYASFKTWIGKDSNAKNMAYMLSAQLSAVVLAVEAGMVDGSAQIVAPGLIPFGDDIGDPLYGVISLLGVIEINDLITAANTELGLHGLTKSGSLYRAYQEALKNTLEKVALNQAIQLCTLP